jgi:integrase
MWSDIDFDNRTVIVRTRKNDEFLVIPMTERLFRLLAERRQALSDERTVSLRVVDCTNVYRRIVSAAKRAGIKHVHPHMLRHTFATRLRDKGVPLDRIMELLGQKSLKMALRYAKARPQQLVDAIAALDRR